MEANPAVRSDGAVVAGVFSNAPLAGGARVPQGARAGVGRARPGSSPGAVPAALLPSLHHLCAIARWRRAARRREGRRATRGRAGRRGGAMATGAHTRTGTLNAAQVLAEAPRERREFKVQRAAPSASGPARESSAGVGGQVPFVVDGRAYDVRGREVAGAWEGAPAVAWRPPARWAPRRVRDALSTASALPVQAASREVYRVGGVLYDTRGRRVVDRLSGELADDSGFEPPHGWVPTLDPMVDQGLADTMTDAQQREADWGGAASKVRGKGALGAAAADALSLDDEVGMRLEAELGVMGGTVSTRALGLMVEPDTPPRQASQGRRTASSMSTRAGSASGRRERKAPHVNIVEARMREKRMQDAWDALG